MDNGSSISWSSIVGMERLLGQHLGQLRPAAQPEPTVVDAIDRVKLLHFKLGRAFGRSLDSCVPTHKISPFCSLSWP